MVRLSLVIKLTEKLQLDYVRLQNQSNNNPTDWVRMIFRSVSTSLARFIELVLCLSIDNSEVVATCNVKLAKGEILSFLDNILFYCK